MSTHNNGDATSKDLEIDQRKQAVNNEVTVAAELDDFGLPVRPKSRPVIQLGPNDNESDGSDDEDTFHDAKAEAVFSPLPESSDQGTTFKQQIVPSNDNISMAPDTTPAAAAISSEGSNIALQRGKNEEVVEEEEEKREAKPKTSNMDTTHGALPSDDVQASDAPATLPFSAINASPPKSTEENSAPSATDPAKTARHSRLTSTGSLSFPEIKKEKRESGPVVSGWSHQALAPREDESDKEEEVEWQAMTAIDEFDIYDDDGRLVARGMKGGDEDSDSPYVTVGGYGKGYTRVLDDEDAQSATSMDEDTNYLFKNKKAGNFDHENEAEDDNDDSRDALEQLEATKDLLTEGQRIAYVAVVRLTIFKMVRALGSVETTRGTRKDFLKAAESIEKWGQSIMVQLYKHMDIDSAEQVMIEQLAEHGLEAADLAPPLMQNAKIKNPVADEAKAKLQEQEKDKPKSRPNSISGRSNLSQASTVAEKDTKDIKIEDAVPEVHGPEDMPASSEIDLDIRWTVLCDLFLVLISGGLYDARSRRLLERVGSSIQISWVQICRFEKRIMDQIETQESTKENWDESDHIEDRRKKGLKRKYVVMGLATVGGGLVIGLSAGLLAPVIGAGFAAGFTAIGVGGTAGFLGGVGGAALITSAATAAGGTIAVRASHRRTGHVQTFEYRPLHNNKRLNLILTVSGWMTGKVDDVRLPFSTVDPIMGDIYSLLWEPDMLRSMGDTINILATEALTSSIQQVLGVTVLAALMASLQLPIVLTKLAYLIDNPWTVSLDRANSAGLILADSLIARHLGSRPVTLLGFSLGARVIFSCLKELADRGAHGIVQNVYLFGSPVVAKRDEYLRARCVIAGRFVNGYASNDWILGYLFRATSGGIMRVAGLAPVEDIPGLENMDVTELVNGHMAYRAAMPKLLVKVGWEVESEEFTEIEDPDPENHAQRQRELIREIDEARKQAEHRPEKKRFGLFKRGKLAEKKEWENYAVKKSPVIGSNKDTAEDPNAHILFDIDAIRKELLSEQIEVRELDSTLPPMQFTTIQKGEKETEYVRLPAGIQPDEVAKMKLPPRPGDLDDEPSLSSLRNPVVRTQSASAATGAQQPQNPAANGHGEANGVAEKAVSVSPTYTAGSGQSLETADRDLRPSLRKHDTEPYGLGLTAGGSNGLVHAYNDELEDNAWADDPHARNGEIKMTFE